MNKIETTYQITVSDYRQACYYALANRQYRSLRFLLLLFGATLISLLTADMWPQGREFTALLAVIGAVWLLTLFARMEKGISRYLKSDQNMIGCTYTVTLESHRITVKVPQKKVNFTIKVNELAAVFELSREFMIYINEQDTYLLPFRALTPEQLAEVKDTFRRHLGERFTERITKRRR